MLAKQPTFFVAVYAIGLIATAMVGLDEAKALAQDVARALTEAWASE